MKFQKFNIVKAFNEIYSKKAENISSKQRKILKGILDRNKNVFKSNKHSKRFLENLN